MPRRQSFFVGDLESCQTNLLDDHPKRNRRQSVSNVLNSRRKSFVGFFNQTNREDTFEISSSPPSQEYLFLKKQMNEKAAALKRR